MFLFRNVLQNCVRTAAFGSLLAASTLATQAQVVWSTPVNVSQAVSGFSVFSQVAVDASGNIDVVWEWHGTPQANYQILFARSTDGGSTFSTPVTLSNSSISSGTPHVALDGSGNINVIWGEGAASFSAARVMAVLPSPLPETYSLEVISRRQAICIN